MDPSAGLPSLMLAVLAGEDADGRAADRLATATGAERDQVVGHFLEMLTKVKGAPAEAAVGVLERLGVVTEARDDLDSPSPERRIAGAWRLGLLQQSDDVPAIVDLLDDPEPEVRHAAVKALGALGDPLGGQAIFDVLDERGCDWLACEPVTEAISALAHGLVPDLEELLTEPGIDPRLVEMAASVAGRAQLISMAPLLRDLVAADTPAPVRVAATQSLGLLGSPADGSLLLDQAKVGQPPEVRLAAVGALGELGVAASVRGVSDLIGDADGDVAAAAARALSGSGRAGHAMLRRFARLGGPSAEVAARALASPESEAAPT